MLDVTTISVSDDASIITNDEPLYAYSRASDTVYRIDEWIQRADYPNIAVSAVVVTPDDVPGETAAYEAYDTGTTDSQYDGATEEPTLQFEPT